MGAFAFLFSPVEGRDVSAFRSQLGIVATAFARTYQQLGLIAPDHPAGAGVHTTLKAAAAGWRAKWSADLAAGWQAGRGEGLAGRLGGWWLAVIAGRHEIVKDTTAVAVGWAMWLAVWLALVSLALDGFVGVAHAAENNDLARKVVGGILPVAGATGSLLSQGLGLIAKTLCVACFTLSGLAVIWNAVVLVVEHTQNYESAKSHYSLWLFCLRIIVAIAMLTPLNGGWGVGQKIALNVGMWGSDKANEAWSAMSGYLGDKKAWVGRMSVPDNEVLAAVQTTASAEACAAAYNQDPTRSPHTKVVYTPTSDGFWGRSVDVAGGCGVVQFPSLGRETGKAAGAVLNDQKAAFEAMRAQVSTEIQAFVKNRVVCRDNPECAANPSPANIAAMPAAYRANLETKLQASWQTLNSAASDKVGAVSKEQGWIGAGTWAQTLSSFQDSMAAASRGVPRVTPPSLEFGNQAVAAVHQWLGNGLMASDNPVFKAQVSAHSGMAGAEDGLLAAVGTSMWEAIAEVDQTNPLSSLSTVGHTVFGIGVGTLAVSGAVEGIVGMVAKNGVDGKEPGMTDRVVNTAGEVMGGLAKRLPIVSAVVGAIGGAVKPIVNGAALAMILAGLALAYLVPALPFIRFYFAVLAWLTALVEAVMLVPLSLVLMVNAERGSFLPPAAKAGLWNVVAVVLRPILTVAGFVIGLMLISAAIGLLNTIMLSAVRDIMQGGVMLMAFVAYVLVYMGVAYVTVNVCTKTAETLPNAAYRWLGANASGERDDGGTVTATLSGVGTRVMTEIGMRARAAGRAPGKV